MGAYEALWDEDGASFKTIFEKLNRRPDMVPSDLVEPSRVEQYRQLVSEAMAKAKVSRYGVRVFGAGEYPGKLRDADHPIALLYYRGWWDLVNSRCIAVVGTRTPSAEGQKRAQQLVKSLLKDNFTIVSGLAKGIDRIAHETAIEANGRTIAVIGTPISYSYPAENRALQERIARDFLLISQVPVKRWQNQGPKQNRIFFPERNITMSALTEGTVIVGPAKRQARSCRRVTRSSRDVSCSSSIAASIIHPSHGRTASRTKARSGCVSMPTSNDTFPRLLTEIDDLTRPDHYWLIAADQCLFLGEYTARKSFSFSATNQIILNFKKAADRRGRTEWRYKEQAITEVGQAFGTALNPAWLATATLVPMPPSKARTDPLYDDRMVRMLRAIPAVNALDIRELLIQGQSMAAAHDADVRPEVAWKIWTEA